MTNLERLEMETKGIELPMHELPIYLEEEGILPFQEYDASSNLNKRKIYSAALSILHSVANNVTYMKNYKSDDITVTDFAESLQNRIDQLEYKIRMMPTNDDNTKSTNTFMLFSS